MFPYIRFTDTITLPLYGPVFMIGFFIALLIARKVGPDYGVAKEDILFGTVYGRTADSPCPRLRPHRLLSRRLLLRQRVSWLFKRTVSLQRACT